MNHVTKSHHWDFIIFLCVWNTTTEGYKVGFSDLFGTIFFVVIAVRSEKQNSVHVLQQLSALFVFQFGSKYICLLK